MSPSGTGRIATVPTAISVARLAGAPAFCWLLLDDRRTAAFGLLAVLGATDWVDGWIARRYDQQSTVGAVLDPSADRLLLVSAAVALLVDGAVPLALGVVVLVRELVVSAATLGLAAAGAARIDVQWVGKAGTFWVMFALPGFLLADLLDPGAGRDVVEVLSWGTALGGVVLLYTALVRYVPLARRALRAGRRTIETST
jgi:cardiolipin synthase